jgi:hypothetical protein
MTQTNNFNFKLIDPQHKTPRECLAYIKEYFVPLLDGSHAVLENGKFVIKDQQTLKKVYFDRMPLYKTGDDDDDCNNKPFDFSKWYFTKYTGLRSITYELDKDVFFDDKINLCPRMKHKYFKYDWTEDDKHLRKLKKKLDIMLNYIKEVLASGNEDVFKYIIQWLAHMVKGGKNDSILYLKSKQGTGKSTLCEFLREHVIGDDLSLESGSAPIISNFNAILGGKLFIYFEELETFSTAQWMSVSSRLKRYATSSTITLEDKNIKAYTTKNIMNIMIASNNDAVMDDDGRRYMILDISTHRQIIPNCDNARNRENIKFWSDIRSCFNDEVGSVFYSYLMEVDTSKYRPQDFPITQSKLDSYAKRLESHELFIKFNYVLSKSEMKTNVGDLYDEYVTYCKGNGIIKHFTKIDFHKKIKETGIETYKSGDKLKIKVTAEELAEIAKCQNWVHSTDEYYDKDSKKEKKEVSGLDYGLDFVEDNDFEKKYNALQEKYELMRLEMEKLKAQLDQPPKQQKEVESEVDDDEFEALIENARTVEPKVVARSTVKKIKSTI